MIKLKDTTIRRGGVTSRTWYESHRNCRFGMLRNGKSMQFRFSIASKGGGRTDIQVEVGQADIATIIDHVVESMPDNIRVVPKLIPDDE